MNRLYTKEGESLSGIPHSEYPRPTMIRNSYINLNGEWSFGTCKEGKTVREYGRITVPFPPESILSGVEKHYPDGTELHYKKSFTLPDGFKKDRVLLHFGAIDQCATIYVNDTEVGYHIGGYDAFSFDITECLKDGENNIHVCATDNLNTLRLPYGKQREKRGGMWYTPVSGIWQTVWIESVPENHIQFVNCKADSKGVDIYINENLNGKAYIETPTEIKECDIHKGHGRTKLPSPIYWSPENPYLYNVTIKTDSDEVKTYFALRTLEIKEVNGLNRLCLNGKPYFFHGLLDQGYWSDGIFTPASYQCFENDIMTAKNLGFNMLRKHIKTEPEYFYYLCDKLGMVVFQDMINNSDYSFFRDTALPTIGIKKRNDKKMHNNPAERKAFSECSEKIILSLKKHPCVCLWTIFNEGWGQFEGELMYDFAKALDNTRFIDTASGWFTCEKSDVDSIHTYFKKYVHKKSEKPVILSEFGGYSYKLKEHSFNTKKTYGYGKFKTGEEFTEAVKNLYYNEIIPSVKEGLCATVYTQLSDVEDETNGIMTYDRRVLKLSEETMLPIRDALFAELE